MALDAIPEVSLGEKGLTLTAPGLESQYFNYFWLRDNCPTSFDPVTRERSYSILTEAAPPRPASARLEGETLEIYWAGADGHRTRHPLAWLMARGGRPRPDPAAIGRRGWRADHGENLHRVSFAALQNDVSTRRAWFEAMIVDGISVVTDMPDTDASLTDLAELVGKVRPSFFGDYFDVRMHIEPSNLAFTAAALPMHTDIPAEDTAPGIQFLHCRANTVAGGMSLFADGVAVAEAFQRVDPEGFEILADTDAPFACEHDAFDMRARHRVIERDPDGSVSGLTMSLHTSDVFDMPQEALDRFYPAFWSLGRMLSDPAYVMKFRLNGGECVAFDNHRIVHGREAFTADSGERYLRGCYVDRGELRSRLRVLARADA